jgi:hypothetical protein
MLRSFRTSLILISVSLISFSAASGQAKSEMAGTVAGLAAKEMTSLKKATPAPQQRTRERFPDYLVKAADIQRVPDPQFWRVLNYLLPEVFPRAEGAWHTQLQRYVFYVDSTKWEPEDVEDLSPVDVKEVQVWDSWRGPTPMAIPGLARTRYIVSIETK